MILGQSLFQIFKSSIVMILLLFCSIAALTIIIERWWYFFRNRIKTLHLKSFFNYLVSGNYEEAKRYAEDIKNPLGRMILLALNNPNLSPDAQSDLFYGAIIEERIKYERYLGGLGTIANGATLLGLLGTVTGLIKAFHNIAVTGSGGPAVVAAGIAEALITTAFGLFIGIPSLFFYNYFTKKASDIAMQLESFGERVIVAIYSRPAEKKEPIVEKVEEVKEYWKF